MTDSNHYMVTDNLAPRKQTGDFFPPGLLYIDSLVFDIFHLAIQRTTFQQVQIQLMAVSPKQASGHVRAGIRRDPILLQPGQEIRKRAFEQ
ncbi:hypothetical protein D3C76_1171280 [compost metagenome]